MNVEIGTEAALFPEKEYINGIAIAVRDLLIIKVIRICDRCHTHSLHCSILSLHASNVIVHGPPWFHFEPPQLLDFDFDAGPDPDPALDFDAEPDTAFHSDSAPDLYPASRNDEDLDPQHCWELRSVSFLFTNGIYVSLLS
jgi:hypothetical protein